jgi:hypothetical protein
MSMTLITPVRPPGSFISFMANLSSVFESAPKPTVVALPDGWLPSKLRVLRPWRVVA